MRYVHWNPRPNDLLKLRHCFLRFLPAIACKATRVIAVVESFIRLSVRGTLPYENGAS